jgi:hypothetical protein
MNITPFFKCYVSILAENDYKNKKRTNVISQTNLPDIFFRKILELRFD